MQKACQCRTFVTMKRFFLISLFLLTLTSCSESGKGRRNAEVEYKPRYASRFELVSRADSLFLEVKNPWQGAKDEKMEFYLTGHAKRLICMSSSHTAFLDAIGQSDIVVGVSGRDFLYNQDHKTKDDVGYENAIGYEKIVALKSDIMTVYEVSGENSSQNEKLKKMGVNVVHIADYLEESPLGRAEWIVAFGAMVGKQKEAIEVFDSIVDRYERAKLITTDEKVKVMLNSPYKDVWYMPGDSSYMIRLINDAAGEYLGAGVAEAKSRPISVETAYGMLLKADVWLNPSAHIKSLKQLKEENVRLKDVKAQVYTSSKRTTEAGGSDFWESGVVNPDVVLRDLKKIFNSKGKVNSDSLFYFKKLD